MAGSKNILIIEDDRPISDMYTRALTHAGFSVEAAYTGKDGLALARKKTYDLLLLDIMLPEPDGISILHELRGEDGRGLPDTKIVIITNLAQPKTNQESLRSLADGYIIKANIVPSELAGLIQDLISE